jgi:1,4-alpha-glucan branching enzyme
MIIKAEEQFQFFLDNKCLNPKKLFAPFIEDGKQKMRFFLPDTSTAEVEIKNEILKAKMIDDRGLFEIALQDNTKAIEYKILYPFKKMPTPYAFDSTLNEADVQLFDLGIHYELYNLLGSNPIILNGINGTVFRVWAPNAQKVSLIADFNNFDGRLFPLTKDERSGIWEIFIPFDCNGQKYKYEIFTKEGHLRIKTDPFAFQYEMRPNTAAIVHYTDSFQFDDDLWMQKKVNPDLNYPINIYEVHLGSWKKDPLTEFLNYRTLAHLLVKYCKQMSFTHVELLPVMEHPLDESWGYQITGFFAPTSRYGNFEDFQYFVNYLHNNQIGIILDWVPGHFPLDDFSLNYFDGSPLFEEKNPKMVSHPHWSTSIFDYKSKQVTNFLIASALFWLEKMHVDGLRVDAVSSLLYLDFGREQQEWIPNKNGSNLNLDGIEFIKHLNSIVHKRCKNKLMIAEESSSYQNVTKSTEENGLGFDLKWKMGWMNDSLSYFSTDPIYRKYKHNNLTFSMWYAYSERFLLPLSHDEVVHEKRSLINKLLAPKWMQYANLRLLYSYMMCHPGKKLIFMGAEIAQKSEWNCKDQINWDLLEMFEHRSIQKMVQDLNFFYLENDAFWINDFDTDKYKWVDVNNINCSIISYVRYGTKQTFLCVHNCTFESHFDYFVNYSNVSFVKEVFNTDLSIYGGSNVYNQTIDTIKPEGFKIKLAPMATIIFEISCEKK